MEFCVTLSATQQVKCTFDKLQSVAPLQFLRDTFNADIFPEVAEASAATRDFLHVGFGEPAPLPVRQSDALHPAWRKIR